MSLMYDLLGNFGVTPETPAQTASGGVAKAEKVTDSIYDNITRNVSSLFSDFGNKVSTEIENTYKDNVAKLFPQQFSNIPPINKPTSESGNVSSFKTTAAVEAILQPKNYNMLLIGAAALIGIILLVK